MDETRILICFREEDLVSSWPDCLAPRREVLPEYQRCAFPCRDGPAREREIGRYRGYARATFKKDRRINIRISSKDLEALQKRAVIEGIPYQTLIASVLHKYVSGRLG